MKAMFCAVLLAATTLVSSPLWSQSSNGASSSASFFSNLNAGFGMMYGGLGGNLEIGWGHFSIYGGYGHAPASFDGIMKIKSSNNFQVGTRYYVNVGSDYFFPRLGFGMGWITNYYDQRIGTATYDQTVNGLSLGVGAQIYSEEGLVFNFDAGVGSKVAIFNSPSHPFFFDFYIRPCIGIGYDIGRIFTRSGHTTRLRNREINPFDP